MVRHRSSAPNHKVRSVASRLPTRQSRDAYRREPCQSVLAEVRPAANRRISLLAECCGSADRHHASPLNTRLLLTCSVLPQLGTPSVPATSPCASLHRRGSSISALPVPPQQERNLRMEPFAEYRNQGRCRPSRALPPVRLTRSRPPAARSDCRAWRKSLRSGLPRYTRPACAPLRHGPWSANYRGYVETPGEQATLSPERDLATPGRSHQGICKLHHFRMRECLQPRVGKEFLDPDLGFRKSRPVRCDQAFRLHPHPFKKTVRTVRRDRP